MTDRNVEVVIARLRERAERGLSKYGVTTERDDLTCGQWLAHLQEELLDAAVYIEAERLRRDAEASKWLNDRVRVEQILLDAAKQGRTMGPDELRALGLKIGTPGR